MYISKTKKKGRGENDVRKLELKIYITVID